MQLHLFFQTAERIAKELKGRRILKIINNPKDNWDEQDTNKIEIFENYKDGTIPDDGKKTILLIAIKPSKDKKMTILMTKRMFK